MFNQILLAIRNIKRNKLFSFINIFGLSVGLVLTIHLILYIKYELSFDKFHEKHDRIYRILTSETAPGKDPFVVALSQGRITDVISGVPELESCVRLYLLGRADFEYEKNRFSNNVVAYADSTFFKVFSFRMLSGNPQEAIDDPSGIIITKTLALKAFNTTDVVGKSVKLNGKLLTVAGVLDDIPAYSHLKFDILCGWHEPQLDNMVRNSGNEFRTYVLLRENIDHAAALSKICEQYAGFLTEFKFGRKSGIIFNGVAQKLTDIELHSQGIDWDVAHGNIKDLWLASGLVVFILVIAVLNFINLIIVNAQSRLKEIGVRKVSGASVANMIWQFIGESVITSVISMLIALFIISGITGDFINSVLGTQIPERWIFDPYFIVIIIAFAVFIGIISGIYPALYLSRFSVIEILDGSAVRSGGRKTFPRALVLVQFIIVIFLVSCLAVFYSQVTFIKEKDLGFDKSNVIGINNLNEKVFTSYESIKRRLLEYEGIEEVCLAQGVNVRDYSGQYAGVPGEEPAIVRHNRTTYGFADIFRLQFREGRDFDSTLISDKSNFIINEAASDALGFGDQATGRLMMMNDTGVVIGVVKNFNFSSLHNSIEPLVITLTGVRRGSMYIRLNPVQDKAGAIDYITETIRSFDPLYSLEYSYVDDVFDAMYAQEKRIGKILTFITIVSILLAFIGLIALTSFIILRRVKEIGIRRINGAAITEILVMLNKEYAAIVVIAFIIATPLAVFVSSQWLGSFVFRIPLSFWFFALSGSTAMLLAVCSVSLIGWRAATRNPVEALRYE